jgi:ABC-type multidrug transport system ATPase subunit
VRENLRIHGRLTSSSPRAVDETMELLALTGYASRLAGKLSLGNKQRLSLARALLHGPKLLILDEPVNGLDPAGIIEIRTLLRRLVDERGVTVFMSSHLLDEVEHLADRVGIIHAGKLIEEVDMAELRGAAALAVEVEVDDADLAERVLKEELALTAVTRPGERSLRIADRGVHASAIAKTLVASGVGLERLVPVEEDLERHFMRVTGGEE